MKKLIVLLVCVLCCISCGKDYSKEDVHVATIGTELYIYGGKNSKEFLGKLNASKYDSESIWNTYGTYGNKYNSKCIWNKYGEYGNSYNSYCPFNKYGSNPPFCLINKASFTAISQRTSMRQKELIIKWRTSYVKIMSQYGKM